MPDENIPIRALPVVMPDWDQSAEPDLRRKQVIYECPTCHGDGMDTDIDERRLNAPCDCFSVICLCLRCRSCLGTGLVSSKVCRRITPSFHVQEEEGCPPA